MARVSNCMTSASEGCRLSRRLAWAQLPTSSISLVCAPHQCQYRMFEPSTYVCSCSHAHRCSVRLFVFYQARTRLRDWCLRVTFTVSNSKCLSFLLWCSDFNRLELVLTWVHSCQVRVAAKSQALSLVSPFPPPSTAPSPPGAEKVRSEACYFWMMPQSLLRSSRKCPIVNVVVMVI